MSRSWLREADGCCSGEAEGRTTLCMDPLRHITLDEAIIHLRAHSLSGFLPDARVLGVVSSQR